VAESDLSGNLQSEYVFFDSERVVRKDFPGNVVSYYFSDHLKTASVITDAVGNIKSESDYYPWGGELQFSNSGSNHYKFTGKERDAETGLDYFGARYYSSGLGRFITPDWSATPNPVPYADLTDPQSLNQYSYVRNLPTTRVDADGHDGCCSLSAVWDFFRGAANAYASDNLAGVGRNDQGGTGYHVGQILGDGVATIQGGVEVVLGAGGEVVSTVADATGVGAVVGVPGNIASAAVIMHGSTTFGAAGHHLLKSSNDSSGGSKPTPAEEKPNTGPKAEDAPGVTAGGQATNKHGQKLAPSRKPQVNNVNRTTREAANNAANKGSGVVEHRNPARGGPHFHTKRGDGSKKQDVTHYNYPK
jgi:RHS repeat-associated protein